MPRLMLNDESWSKLELIMLNSGIYDKRKLRLTTEGILYRLRTGCPWRDLPSFFGNWNSIYKRFNDWSRLAKFSKIFKFLSINTDNEWNFIDGSIVKAHQHSTGASKGRENAIGKSVAGNTSKIHMVVDSFGLPIDFIITAGQVHDSQLAPELIERLPKSDYLIADRGYDCEYLRWVIRDRGTIPMIPRKKNSKVGNDDIDWELYKERHLVENIFARLKHFRAIATRFDKLKENFEGLLSLACAYIWLKI